MRDRIEQDGTQLLAFASRLRAAKSFNGARTLDSDGHQAADGLQGLPRQHRTGDAHAAHDAHAHAQWHEGQLMNSIDSGFTAQADQLEIARFQSVNIRTRAIHVAAAGQRKRRRADAE